MKVRSIVECSTKICCASGSSDGRQAETSVSRSDVPRTKRFLKESESEMEGALVAPGGEPLKIITGRFGAFDLAGFGPGLDGKLAP